MNLYVIRHGEVDLNRDKLINGRNDSILNENGINQAKKAGDIIKNMPIDLIICSPIKRTVQTCEYLNVNKIKVLYDDRLMERNSKSYMYQPISTIDISVWYDEELDVIFGDNEGFRSMLKRTKNFLDDLKNFKESNILIVTHGDICKTINSLINNVHGYKNINELHQDNCEIVHYDFN